MPPAKKVCTQPGCDWEGYAMHLPRHMLSAHGIEAVKGTRAVKPDEVLPPEEGERLETVRDVVDAVTVEETAPRKPGIMDRFRSRRGRSRGGSAAPTTRERAPKRPRPGGKRVALDSDISDIWSFGGRRLEHSIHYPTGRMLQYQAPAAGIILDRAIAGTLPDRMLFQPIARNRDKYEDVGFLLAGPLLTFALTQNGHAIEALVARQGEWDEQDFAKYQELVGKQEMLKEMFTWVLSMMLPRLAEGKKKADEKKAKADAAIADAFPDLGPENPVDVLATMLFEPPRFQEEYNNGNGRHAAEGYESGDPAPAPGGEGTFPL